VTARYPRWLIVSLLIVAVGAHWTVLQSAAWIGMLASNLSTTSIREAWSKTFDGKHPCKLCKVVHAGKSAEKKQDNQKPQTKLDLLLIGRPNIAFRWLREPFQLEASLQIVTRIDTPPSPPPESLLG